MSNYSAQGSITIRRLRNGDSLFISLENNGIALYQGVDPTSGAISPKWTDTPANQPIITPKVTSVRGNSVARSNHTWAWNGTTLLFTGAVDGDWQTDSTGKFKLNISSGASAGALWIIKDLADANAVANGQLTYSCVATVSGTNYNLSKSIDVIIQNIGASSYYGTLLASPVTLDASATNATLKTSLMCGANPVTSYYVKWYKDTELWSDAGNGATATAKRSDVDGTQLFIAEFYLSSTDSTPVARAGVYVIDSLDEYVIQFKYTSAAVEVAEGQDVTVQAQVVNTRTNSVEDLDGATWALYVMNKDTWKALKTSASNSITITTTETDYGGVQNDVEVVAEVSF
jgi:hypothetical protein